MDDDEWEEWSGEEDEVLDVVPDPTQRRKFERVDRNVKTEPAFDSYRQEEEEEEEEEGERMNIESGAEDADEDDEVVGSHIDRLHQEQQARDWDNFVDGDGDLEDMKCRQDTNSEHVDTTPSIDMDQWNEQVAIYHSQGSAAVEEAVEDAGTGVERYSSARASNSTVEHKLSKLLPAKRGRKSTKFSKTNFGASGGTASSRTEPIPSIGRPKGKERLRLVSDDEGEGSEMTAVDDPIANYVTRHINGETMHVDTVGGTISFDASAVEGLRRHEVLAPLRSEEKLQRLSDIGSSLRNTAFSSTDKMTNLLLMFFRNSNSNTGDMKRQAFRIDTGEVIYRDVPVDMAYYMSHTLPGVTMMHREFEETELLREPILQIGERHCCNGPSCQGMKVKVMHRRILRELVTQKEVEYFRLNNRWLHLQKGASEPARMCLMCERDNAGKMWALRMAMNMISYPRDSYVSCIYNIVNWPGEYDLTDTKWNTNAFQGYYGPIARHDLLSYKSCISHHSWTGYKIVFMEQANYKVVKNELTQNFSQGPFQ